MKRSFYHLLTACLLAVTRLHAAGEKPGPAAYVTVETRELRIEFAGDRAWTISRIVHKGAEIAGRAGFYGTVFLLLAANGLAPGTTRAASRKSRARS